MRTKKPYVGILTSLVDFSPAYSLVGIILDQARALKRHGYKYDLLVIKEFNREHQKAIEKEGLSIRYVLPQTRLHDYKPNEPPKKTEIDKNGNRIPGFYEQVETHFNGDSSRGWVGYKDALEPYDVVIDHDLMFLSWHLPQNAAIRKCIEMWPDKTWLHWVHSGPSAPPKDLCFPSTLRFSAAPHSHYVFLNETQRLDYSLMINTTKANVSTVYNPRDVRDIYEFSEETCEIIDRYDLFDHQILIVYPFSTPRWREKGIRQLCKILKHWKRKKIRARLVLINAHCNSKRDRQTVEDIEAYAKNCELVVDDDVIITSRYADEKKRPDWRYTVPHRVVRELMFLSNLFVFPSVSECCSLIQAEASISGKFMVLNRDFAPMIEFSHPTVMTYEFTRNDPDSNEVYYECVAREIWANFKQDAVAMNTTEARCKWYNRDWIFRNQFEPLLYRNFAGDPKERKEAQKSVVAQNRESSSRECCPIGVLEFERPDGQVERYPLRETVAEGRVSGEDKASHKEEIKDSGANKGEENAPQNAPEKELEPSFESPCDGMPCPIFGVCTAEQREKCFIEAGHCLMLDQEVEKGA